MSKPIPRYANADLPSTDLAFARVVTASAEEIQLAQELRRLIEQRYLERPGLSEGPSPYWGVVAD